MALALGTPQTILMALCFAAMITFVGVALWLWVRHQRREFRLPKPQSERQASAFEASPLVASMPKLEPAPGSEPVHTPSPDTVQMRAHEPARASASGRYPASSFDTSPSFDTRPPSDTMPPSDEPTEFVALPYLREPDSPAADPYATEIMPAFHEDRRPVERTEIVARLAKLAETFAPEKTEFIPAPLGSRAKFEPPPRLAATTLAPRVEPPAPASMPTAVELPEHLRRAIDAFEQLQREPASPAHANALAGHLEVLASASVSTLLNLISPMLAGPPDHRFAAALLVLLHNTEWPAKTAFAPLLAGFDDAHQRAALQLLRGWDDPRAQPLAAASLATASLVTASLAIAEDLDARLLWLDCFAERGWDPGAAVIEAALADADPRLVTIGLRLLPRCDAAPRLQTKLADLLFAHDDSVRMQALETALAFGDPSAWLVCRQLARNPSFPAAAQLVGLLGTESEINEQVRAFEAAPTAELLAGLGLSGRPVVLRACVERFEDPDLELRAAAHAALTLAAGSTFESRSNAQTWLASQRYPRVLAGTRRWAAQVTVVLSTASEPLRRLLARELRIRSQGKVHVDASLLPHAFARQLAGVRCRMAEIDFDRGFPWSS